MGKNIHVKGLQQRDGGEARLVLGIDEKGRRAKL
jgi:hypothetical protein